MLASSPPQTAQLCMYDSGKHIQNNSIDAKQSYSAIKSTIIGSTLIFQNVTGKRVSLKSFSFPSDRKFALKKI